jgi:hypothetical protein
MITIALCALCASAAAQETWFCEQPGSKLSYVKKDAKGAPEGTIYEYAIKDKKVEDGRVTITYDIAITGMPVTTGCSVWSDHGLFHSDAQAAIGQFGSDIKATGNAPVIPENPSIGDQIADCSIKIESLMLTTEYKKIKFTANGYVTVPAGSFDCWCLEYDVVDTAMGLKAESHVQQWMAKGIGEVKVTTTDKRGRVLSEKVLTKVAKP